MITARTILRLQPMSEMRIEWSAPRDAETYAAIDVVNSKVHQWPSLGRVLVVPVELLRKYGKGSPDEMVTQLWRTDDVSPYLPSDRTIVVSHIDHTVDFDIAWAQHRGRRRGPLKDGRSRSSYTILDHDVAFETHRDVLAKMLRDLMRIDPRLTEEYRMVGSPDLNGQTVGTFLRSTDLVHDVAQRTTGPLIFYHGTSMLRYREVKVRGLRPGKTPDQYGDLVKGWSEHLVYLSTSQSQANNYASRAAVADRSVAAVLEVTVRDLTRLWPDEDTVGRLEVGDDWYKYRFSDFARWSQDYPPEKVKQLLQYVWTRLIPGLRHSGTVGYRGIIRPQDIRLITTYKPQKMKAEPNDYEFSQAMSATRATQKRFP